MTTPPEHHDQGRTTNQQTHDGWHQTSPNTYEATTPDGQPLKVERTQHGQDIWWIGTIVETVAGVLDDVCGFVAVADQLATRAELEQHILQKVAQLATGQRNSMDLTTQEIAHLQTLLERPDA